MSTPIEIVKEKTKQMKSLWESSSLKELVTTSYATDACLSYNGVSHKGHDEILKLYEKAPHATFHIEIINTSAPSDDCVVQTCKFETDGKTENGKWTWKKVNGDWKITTEEWTS